MTPTHYRLIDRLPVPALAALTRTWPDVLAAIAREVPPDETLVLGWERTAEIDMLMRRKPDAPERRTA